jgi:nondiscriminating aspartyl-tRNA synthetase
MSAEASAATSAPAPKIDPKEARKQARLAEEAAKAKEKAEALLQFAAIFGNSGITQSTTHKSKTFTSIASLTKADDGRTVIVRGRLSTVRKPSNKLAFLVVRDEFKSVQAVAAASETTPKELIAFVAQIPAESVVDIEASVTVAETPITSTTQSDVELKIVKIHVLSEAARVLPFSIEDAERSESEAGVKINFDTRLNARWMETRGAASNAIFRLQSRVGQYFRQFLIDRDFIEIHSPKMIATASEGGAGVFKLGYFGRDAYLAQSPQLYKQMAVMGDLKRVFEVGPVFRAENSNTHRHLTEFVGLDVEMAINEHYYEVLDVAEELFFYIFTHLATHTTELATVMKQHPFTQFEFQVSEEKIKELGVGLIEEGAESTDAFGSRVRNGKIRMLRIPYAKCIALLNTVLETPMNVTDDINTANEKRLGALIKERYGVDWFISDRFPSVCRPFYTMPCPDDARFTNSYDMFIRGEEISSGAQRIHDGEMLLARAKSLNVDLTPIKDYVDSFRLGAWPHGGFGVGLERVTMLYLGLSNIRYASLFPRDPTRVTP